MINNSFIDSLIEINIYLISLSVLWFVIRHKVSFLNQRVLLLAIPMISVMIWYFKSQLTLSGMVYAVIPLEPFTVQNISLDNASNPFSFSMEMAYSFGVVIFLLVFVIKIIRVLFFFKDATTNGDIKLNNSSQEDSFSFFNFIHLRADLNEEEKSVVLEHELIHYQKRHSIDLMIFEIYHSLFWFNPLLILMKKELVNIHEFEVDQEMYATHKTNYMRHLLNYALGSNDSHYLLTSPFYNKLTLKKRIKTMKKLNNTNSLLLLLVLPLTALTFTVVSCESSQSIDGIDTQKEQLVGVRPEIQPEFIGGTAALYEFLGENITYPEQSKLNSIEGKVYIQYIIDIDGSIKEAKVLRGVNEEIDAEALRVINMMPNWKPGTVNGKSAAIKMTIPIMFKLN